MNMVDCPYRDKCSSYPYKCNNCRHNKSKKKDYYEPDDGPWPYPHPWLPKLIWFDKDWY